jgi:hypothetical protein
MNAQVIQIKGRDVVLAYHPQGGEPRIGQALRLQERIPHGHNDGLVAQVIGYDSAGYPGDREVALAELLETAVAQRHDVVQGEPALGDLKEIKLARCKIRKMVRGDDWLDWDGTIPSRNVRVTPIGAGELLAHVAVEDPAHRLNFASYEGQRVAFDAALLDKVNALVGFKGVRQGAQHEAHADGPRRAGGSLLGV